ncbi:MAG: helix-turn-helix transcriptional regulator [Dehalococcoidia bacterium]|nr:helix-turn-helix transcriptional regulator [Dehalococcoidia bacterium]
MAAFHDVAAFDRAALMTVDPETMLPSGGLVEGFDPEYCAPFWDSELLDPDFNKFTDLARSVDGVATLEDAVDGDLGRSPRYQKLYSGLGTPDELRVAFVAGTSCLAVGVFLRPAGMGPYAGDELTAVRHLRPLATNALRRALGRIHDAANRRPPTVVMLDGSGAITGMSTGARQMLDDLRGDIDAGELPAIVAAAATKARWSRAAVNLTTRVQGRSGEWLRLHVTPMEGEAGPVAMTIEPARPDDLVRVLLESYGLTQRETEIVLLLARGLSTKEIAAELIISAHTVRDYVKSIYDKAGVNSRGELVARLFSNHVLNRFHSAVLHRG